jgi:hypothetical protein
VGSPRPIDGRLLAWQAEWSSLPEQADRIAAAVRSSPVAVAALQDYLQAYRRDLNSHADGVTAVAILKLLEHCGTRFSLFIPEQAEACSTGVDDLFDLIPAVRLAARASLERAEDSTGAHATLGELLLVSGDQASPVDREAALFHYREAAQSKSVREALLGRLRMFGRLGFRPGLVSEATGVLEAEPQSAP